MIVTTTDGVEGRAIVEYRGIVSGEAVMGTNVFRDFFAGKRCERPTLVFSLTSGRSSRAGVRESAIAGGRRRSSPACS